MSVHARLSLGPCPRAENSRQPTKVGREFLKKSIPILSAAVLASLATSASAWVNPLKHRYVDGELKICDQGRCFVGGVPKVTTYATSSTAGPPEQIIIGQMYVQFEIPKKRRQWPLIIMQGSSHTGT
jgi:hypothetical protein